VERPCEGAAESGSQLRSTNAERAEPSRVHAANVSPAEGEGGTLERRSGVDSKKLLQRTRVAGLQRVFRAFSRAQVPPENGPPRGEASPSVPLQTRFPCRSSWIAGARSVRSWCWEGVVGWEGTTARGPGGAPPSVGGSGAVGGGCRTLLALARASAPTSSIGARARTSRNTGVGSSQTSRSTVLVCREDP